VSKDVNNFSKSDVAEVPSELSVLVVVLACVLICCRSCRSSDCVDESEELTLEIIIRILQ